jgi:cellulose synthase operon protein C
LIRDGGAVAERQIEPLIALETGRLRYDELGQILETYAGTLRGLRRSSILVRAANVYLTGGDEARALAVMESIGADSQAMNELRNDYFRLLLAHSPDRLEELAGKPNGDIADAAANYLLANSDEARSTAAIAARVRPAVWKSANTALVGLYFGDKSDATNTAFVTTVGDRTIGERVTQKFDSTNELAGHTWFYYGMRYGVYRSFAGHGDEEDYISAGLEDDPANLDSYEALAQTYADAGEREKALNEYREALQLSPHSAGIYDAMAEIEWGAGNHDGAIADWKTALGILRNQVDVRVAPESFWTNFTAIAGHLGEKKLAPTFKPEMDAVVRSYIAKNGDYESESLLEAAFSSLGDPQQGIAWVIDLAMAARDPAPVVSQLQSEAWIPQSQQLKILEILIELERRPLTAEEKQNGATEVSHANELAGAQIKLIGYLIANEQFERASATLESMTPEARASHVNELLPYQIEMAARSGTLVQWLASYIKSPPSDNDEYDAYEYRDDLRLFDTTAQTLLSQGDSKSASLLLEYVLRRRQETGAAMPGDYLSLAEAQIAANDLPDALEQLRSLTLAAELYSSLDSAAQLLERTGHDAEALEFLAPLAKGVPWEPEYRLRLARAEQKAQVKVPDAQAMLLVLAQDSSVAYSVRVQAATALNGAGNQVPLGSGELTLLASGAPIAPEQANLPYYLAARVAAARNASNAEPILFDALACGPSDEARLMLFEKGFALGHNAVALAAINPLVNDAGNQYPVPRWVQNSEGDAQEQASGAELAQIPEKQRFKVAGELATIYERTGNLPSAVSWIGTAISGGGDVKEQRQLEAHKATLEKRMAVDAENAIRRPVIQASLDQQNVVRPRIAAPDLGRGAQQ